MMKLLMQKDDLKVYIRMMPIWTDPILYMEYEGETKCITRPSGEYENEFGTFFFSDYELSQQDEVRTALMILHEIGDINTFRTVKWLDWIEFRVKDEYLQKMHEFDKEYYDTKK